MNLPDAIERLRAMHEETLDRISKWDAVERAHPLRTNHVMTEAFTLDAQALAVCIEALEALEAPRSTLKSAPPLTPEERMR